MVTVAELAREDEPPVKVALDLVAVIPPVTAVLKVTAFPAVLLKVAEVTARVSLVVSETPIKAKPWRDALHGSMFLMAICVAPTTDDVEMFVESAGLSVLIWILPSGPVRRYPLNEGSNVLKRKSTDFTLEVIGTFAVYLRLKYLTGAIRAGGRKMSKMSMSGRVR
jgi:hypothetical protein